MPFAKPLPLRSGFRAIRLAKVAALTLSLVNPVVGNSQFSIEESLEVGKAVSDFRVGFSLYTDQAARLQYVAYYDDQRRMTVASRKLDSKRWKFQTLPSKVGWDSHNYVTMAVDRLGHLHVTGNMHVNPLVYFRTSTPGDISSLKASTMTGEREERVTYPRFLTNREGELVFNYRDGGSGRGVRFYNKYDPDTRTWTRLLEKRLIDGGGERNAYPLGPVQGPDGWFHMVWVWRMTPDCATNHHLSYARSRDLISWESSAGRKVELPITFDQDFLLIDPIPVGGGIINGGAKLSFDPQQRPLVTYHKSDPQGHMQIYAARPRKDQWTLHPLTRWKEPIPFSGSGSMGFIGIRANAPIEIKPGVLSLSYQHRDRGRGRIFFDPETLEPLSGPFKVPKELPSSLGTMESNFPGMQGRQANDIADTTSEGVRYLLRWESLGANRDKAPKPPHPKPSTLRLYKLVDAKGMTDTP